MDLPQQQPIQVRLHTNQSRLIVTAATRGRNNSILQYSKTVTPSSASITQKQRSKIQMHHQLDNIRPSVRKQHQHCATLHRMQQHQYTSIFRSNCLCNYYNSPEKSTSTLDSFLPVQLATKSQTSQHELTS
ncbi:hypothetical protein Nepgr_032268 [Nepenthes gracilis]|uniref:Uncharacterized protein n=1 Tax=Nepenthes gracilis TaxID=150966 RepID=A0AAD3TI97_NEPGR|nr:hypothetical protein Nepgr_032268 [Nepenthes gracilis]